MSTPVAPGLPGPPTDPRLSRLSGGPGSPEPSPRATHPSTSPVTGPVWSVTPTSDPRNEGRRTPVLPYPHRWEPYEVEGRCVVSQSRVRPASDVTLPWCLPQAGLRVRSSSECLPSTGPQPGLSPGRPERRCFRQMGGVDDDGLRSVGTPRSVFGWVGWTRGPTTPTS